MAMADAKDKAPAAKPVPTGTELMLHFHRTGGLDGGEHKEDVKAFLARYGGHPFVVNDSPPSQDPTAGNVAHAYRLRGGKLTCEEIDVRKRAMDLRGVKEEEAGPDDDEA